MTQIQKLVLWYDQHPEIPRQNPYVKDSTPHIEFELLSHANRESKINRRPIARSELCGEGFTRRFP